MGAQCVEIKWLEWKLPKCTGTHTLRHSAFLRTSVSVSLSSNFYNREKSGRDYRVSCDVAYLPQPVPQASQEPSGDRDGGGPGLYFCIKYGAAFLPLN